MPKAVSVVRGVSLVWVRSTALSQQSVRWVISPPTTTRRCTPHGYELVALPAGSHAVELCNFRAFRDPVFDFVAQIDYVGEETDERPTIRVAPTQLALRALVCSLTKSADTWAAIASALPVRMTTAERSSYWEQNAVACSNGGLSGGMSNSAV